MSSLDNFIPPWFPFFLFSPTSSAAAASSFDGDEALCFADAAASLAIGLKPVLAAANTSGMFCSGLRYTGDTALHAFLPGAAAETAAGWAGRRLLACC